MPSKRPEAEAESESEHVKRGPSTGELERLFELSLDLLCLLGFDRRFRLVSPAFERLLGHALDGVVGTPLDRLVHPDDLESTLTELERTAAGDEAWFENRLRCRDSSYRWLQWRVVPAVDEQLLYASARDVTVRKETETALRASEDRFRTFMDESPAIAMMKDEEGRYVYVSQRWLEGYGLTKEQVIGRTAYELFPEDIAGHYRRHELEVLASGETIASVEPRLRKDGTRGWGLAYKFPVTDPAGRARVGGVGVDITEWKLAEEELREAEARYRTLVEQLPVATYVDRLDEHSSNVYTSPQIEAMLGYSSKEWKHDAELFYKLLHPEDRERVLAEHMRARETKEPLQSEYRLIARDGRTVWVKDHAQVLLDADGAPSALQGYLVDVTEQRAAAERHERLETDLRHAQKMEALGRLAGGVAHDFNNLLTAIAGYSEVLVTELPPDEPLREAAEEIARAADRAGMLTRQLLTFSRRRIVQGQVLDLHEVVSATAPMLRRLVREDVVFSTILDPGPLWIEGDPGQLEQVIVNLVVNARDAMPTGGRLTIETRTLELAADQPDRHPELPRGTYVSLSVSDEGEGIDDGAVGRIFEPFFTTKEIGQGTGLGLSIVYAIVRESGGQVVVESEPGRGSTFSVFLPAASAARMPSDAEEPEIATHRGSGNVLLVEDEDVVRDLVARTLRQQGYQVLEARDGEEALALVETCGELELILTDLVMPRMSGYELAERLRSSRPDTCVVFISGYASDRVAAGRSLPSDAVLVEKPFTPSHLLQRLDEALRTSRAAR